MSTGSGNLFAEFLEDYFAESEEHLSSARQNLLALENAGTAEVQNVSITNLLRSFHSLKGLSAMVGVNEITQLSHLIEEYLRQAQTSHAAPNASALDKLRKGVDGIELVLTARRKNAPAPDISAILNALRQISSPDKQLLPKEVQENVVESGVNWHFSFSPSAQLAEQGINVNLVREKLRQIGTVVNASPRIIEGTIVFDFVVRSQMSEAEIQNLIPAGVTFEASAAPPPVQESLPPAEDGGTAVSSFVRVEMSKLDELMRLIGEMVISRTHFDETIRSLETQIPQSGFRNLQELNSRLERQLRSVRDAVMHVRMVPIGQIFERMRFVVRGLERDTNKRVHLQLEGQDTQIDKLIVDRMLDPLLHMVRNAVSHGIEKEGTIRIAARTHGEKVVIEVRDDGVGVDFDRVLAKAQKAGLIGPNQTVDSSNILDVICAPGFSTREGADLASGRGVGMAVVKSTIQELGGSLAMDTAAGRGTVFTITLPLTLVILAALLVNSGGYRYAVPQSGVREVIAVDVTEIKHLERNSLVHYRGGVLPLIPISDILRIDERFTVPVPRKHPRKHVLVIGADAKAVGLIVDKVTGQREIVVRSISDPHLRIPGIIGATELGDGKPVLIVDAETLARLDRQRKDTRG
jgi:two-component system chemotaxis sensor kinase CheA